MMKRKIFIIIILGCLLLSGCWDLVEIENSVLPVSYGFTSLPDDLNKFRFFIEYSSISPEKLKRISIVTLASTVQEGINNFERRVNGKIVHAQLAALFFDENLSRRGLKPYLNYFWRDPIVPGTVILAVVQNKLDDLYKSEISKDNQFGKVLRDIITNNSSVSFQIPDQTLFEFYVRILTKGIDPYLPYIRGGDKDFSLVGVVLFRNDKMVGILDENLTQVLLMIQSVNSIGCITLPDDKVSYFVRLEKTEIKPKLVKGKITTSIKIKINCDLIEAPFTINISEDKKKVSELENKLNDYLENQTYLLLKKLQHEFKVDPIGIGKIMRARYPKYFAKIDWYDEFKNITFRVKVESRIRLFKTTS
ncbi:hypothetical protein BBF96_12490 [Anoxybacter fermentans]|uniref:Uncharacterized protein n=1 Tax=Anoxybacter fermentans TaxID=1323375 RepID=A0A3Q9HSB7_9FIRM|nr:Ger(x)C family spore germination protein [Anoxybacter fermentans]AZR74143.1 hypothetical protein BBF96_12490 [Anoxybacter fermentans]